MADMADMLKDGRTMALSAAVDSRISDAWFWGICAIFVRRMDRDHPGWRTWDGATTPCYEHEKPPSPRPAQEGSAS